MVLGPAPWPRTSALGDSTRRYSALSSKRAPPSKATVSVSCAGLRRSSVGQGSLLAIAFLVRKLACFIRQHHRHTSTDGIGQARRPGHQLLLLAVIMQPRLGQGTDQDLQ